MTVLFSLGFFCHYNRCLSLSCSSTSLGLYHQTLLPMARTNHLAASTVFFLASYLVAASSDWHFVQNGTSGIVALESIIVSDNLAIFFDRASNDPLQVNDHPAWGALYNLETNTASPLDLITDSFCASGGFLSNGTMVNSNILDPLPGPNKLHRSVSVAMFLSFLRQAMAEWESEYGNHVMIPME